LLSCIYTMEYLRRRQAQARVMSRIDVVERGSSERWRPATVKAGSAVLLVCPFSASVCRATPLRLERGCHAEVAEATKWTGRQLIGTGLFFTY
jgi:hypothetical protein